MGITTAGGYCDTCQERSTLQAQTPNHVLHLLLTLVTGLWAIVWLAVSLQRPPYQCSRCGGLNVTFKIPEEAAKMRECPFCAEPIRAKAFKCKHCGSELEAGTPPT